MIRCIVGKAFVPRGKNIRVPSLRPRRARGVALHAGLVALVGAGSAARAGNYVLVSQSGGTVTAPISPYPGASTVIESHPYYFSGTGAATGYLFNGPRPLGHYRMSGAITTIFQWQPNQITDPATGLPMDDPTDKPPTSAILHETCDAFTTTYDLSQNQGSVKDGLNHPAMLSMDGLFGTFIYSLEATGTRCKIVGGPTVTATCSPSADITYTTGDWIGIGVAYSVDVTPVTLTLSGVTDFDGAHNALIGQGVRASINAGSYTLIKPNWTISGDKFRSYNLGGAVSVPPGYSGVPYTSASVSDIDSTDLMSLSPPRVCRNIPQAIMDCHPRSMPWSRPCPAAPQQNRATCWSSRIPFRCPLPRCWER